MLCSKCKQPFTQSESDIRNRKWDCRSCRTAYERERRLKNPEPYREACREWRARYKRKHPEGRTKWLIERSVRSDNRKDEKKLLELVATNESKLNVSSYV